MIHDERQWHGSNVSAFQAFYNTLAQRSDHQIGPNEIALIEDVATEISLTSRNEYLGDSDRDDERFARHEVWFETRRKAKSALAKLRRIAGDDTALSVASDAYERIVRRLTDDQRRQIQDEHDLKIPKDVESLISTNPSALQSYVAMLESRRPLNKKLLNDGTVIVHVCKSDLVVQSLPFKDEGVSFFFKVGERRIMCICHVTEDQDHISHLPNNHFEFVTTSIPSRFHWVNCLGQKIEPVLTVSGTQLLFESTPWPFAVVDADLLTFEDDLLKASYSN
jgi:hypothetical protein